MLLKAAKNCLKVQQSELDDEPHRQTTDRQTDDRRAARAIKRT